MTGPADAVKTCAVCKKPASVEHRPFCSRRCADVDLQRWFAGAYAIPAEEAPADPSIPQADPGS